MTESDYDSDPALHVIHLLAARENLRECLKSQKLSQAVKEKVLLAIETEMMRFVYVDEASNHFLAKSHDRFFVDAIKTLRGRARKIR